MPHIILLYDYMESRFKLRFDYFSAECLKRWCCYWIKLQKNYRLLFIIFFSKLRLNEFICNLVNLFTGNIFLKFANKNDFKFICTEVISLTHNLLFEITAKYDFKFTILLVNIFTRNLFFKIIPKHYSKVTHF